MGGTWVWQCGEGAANAEEGWAALPNLPPNIGKHGFPMDQMTKKIASTSCNHLFMDAMQVKQNSIGYEWVVHGSGSMLNTEEGWAALPNLPPNTSIIPNTHCISM